MARFLRKVSLRAYAAKVIQRVVVRLAGIPPRPPPRPPPTPDVRYGSVAEKVSSKAKEEGRRRGLGRREQNELKATTKLRLPCRTHLVCTVTSYPPHSWTSMIGGTVSMCRQVPIERESSLHFLRKMSSGSQGRMSWLCSPRTTIRLACKLE